jgi:hypothetical protein
MTAPLKVDEATDQIATQAAHFLGVTKKQFIAEAVSSYANERRSDIESGVKAALRSLDGSRASAVQLLTGMSLEESVEPAAERGSAHKALSLRRSELHGDSVGRHAPPYARPSADQESSTATN